MSVSKTILLVDDEVSLLEMLEDFLGPHEANILKATSGEEAIEILGREKLDLMICDVNMPHGTGVDILEAVNVLDYNVPIIMCSAYGTEYVKKLAEEHGVLGFIDKPNFEELDELVKQALS